MQISVALIDHDTHTDPHQLAAVATALTVQAQQHFAPAWGISAAVRVDTVPRPGDWAIYLLKDPDQPGALGDHDETPDGYPLGRVFPILDEQYKVPWSTTASHELLEMLADPYLSRAVQMPSGKFLALESCDAVENDSYKIGDVLVSDFCTPAWFEPPRKIVKYDYMGLLKKPFTLRPGGYMQVFDPTKGWQQITHRQQPKEPADRRYSRQDYNRLARRIARTIVGL